MKLLLCDDEKMLSRALAVLLKKNNYTVDCAYDGDEALDFILSTEYDAIILDVMMPKRDGFSVLREIRKKGIKTPVIMLTAKSQIDDKLNGLDSGADDYLTKPFSTLELLARLRAIIRRKYDNNDNIYVFNSLELDPLTYKLKFNNKEENLCTKEFQIMELFMQNPNKIITQDYLLEKIYGFDEGDVTTLWVYISYLRKKLKNLHANVKIQAVRNTGYMMEALDD